LQRNDGNENETMKIRGIGHYNHNLIPRVGTTVIFPKQCDIGISCLRMLIHDNMLKDDSYRYVTSETPLCD